MFKSIALACFIALFATGSAFAGDAARGEKIFATKCSVCHGLDANKIGPMARTIYGRAAGRVTGYNYSANVKTLDLAWTEDTLNQWLTNPAAMAAGTKMTFRLPEALDRADVIAYLKTLSVAAQAKK